MKRNKIIPFILIFLLFLSAGCVTHREGFVNGTVSVNGTAESSTLSSYKLELGEGRNPSSWRIVGLGLTSGGTVNINEDVLGNWDTTALSDGQYTLRLTVTDTSGASSQDEVYLTVDNVPDAASLSCPSWSCSGLVEGANNIDIKLLKEQYGNNMNCSVNCQCGAGMTIAFETVGDLEDYYDNVSVNPSYGVLTGSWEGFANLSGTGNGTIHFRSDRSYNGSDGYGGFNITKIYCSPYCYSKSSDYYYEYISRVVLNGGDQRSNGSYYSEYGPAAFTSLAWNNQYNISVELSSPYATKDQVKAWIDYNHDHDFMDDGEEISLGNKTFNTKQNFSALFTVPQNAVLGVTKMRVSNTYYPSTAYNLTPCKYISYGEVEDYVVNITSVAATTTSSTATSTTTTIGGQCALAGDTPPCGEVTVSEIIASIVGWGGGETSLADIISLIGQWSDN